MFRAPTSGPAVEEFCVTDCFVTRLDHDVLADGQRIVAQQVPCLAARLIV